MAEVTKQDIVEEDGHENTNLNIDHHERVLPSGDNDIILSGDPALQKVSEDELHKDKLFDPPYKPNNPRRTREDFQDFGERLIEKQWNKLWKECYERVIARQARGGTYDPVKEKRVFDASKGEKDSYDTIQGKQESLEWVIDQLMECYVNIKSTYEDLERKQAEQKEVNKDLESLQQALDEAGYEEDENDGMLRVIESQKKELQAQIAKELHQLRVRKTLLKRAGQNHLWHIAKQDCKYKYTGETLRGLVTVRNFFANMGDDITDELMHALGTKLKLQDSYF
ncbi:hypothetical protein ABW21_db0209058 [Orbilia brochopaga]|nr:hypothetical protein ABW21_db0209058 [Drechslerella brochopaga]